MDAVRGQSLAEDRRGVREWDGVILSSWSFHLARRLATITLFAGRQEELALERPGRQLQRAKETLSP
jgi:hypothetical protein